MTKDDLAYKVFKKEYEEERQYRKDNPVMYPWFVYFQFGWHNMFFSSDEEVEEMVRFYKLWKTNNGWERSGRQPIYISRRK